MTLQRPVLEDITIVIPTLGRAILKESLSFIASGSCRPARIIVVDQGCSSLISGMLDALRSEGIDTLYQASAETGRASAVNQGIRLANTRFIAVTDDDCFVAEAWLENLATHLRKNPDAIITGRVEAGGTERVLSTLYSMKSVVYHRPRLRSDSLCGGNMGAATDVLKRLGPLDEDVCLRTAEDCEYSYRALRSGTPIMYCPDVTVRHFGWREETQRATQYNSYARSHAGFLGKYLRRGDPFIALRIPVHLARSLRRWLRGLLIHDRDLALNGRAYVMQLLPGLIAGWRSR